jgi:uncharacterized membrane protein
VIRIGIYSLLGLIVGYSLAVGAWIPAVVAIGVMVATEVEDRWTGLR